MNRPECWDFAMDFLGGPDDKDVQAVTAYVEHLEAAVKALQPEAGPFIQGPMPDDIDWSKMRPGTIQIVYPLDKEWNAAIEKAAELCDEYAMDTRRRQEGARMHDLANTENAMRIQSNTYSTAADCIRQLKRSEPQKERS